MHRGGESGSWWPLGIWVPLPHCGMLGFRPTISPNGPLSSFSWCSRASPGQTSLSEAVIDPADCLAMGFVCTIATVWDTSFPLPLSSSLALELMHCNIHLLLSFPTQSWAKDTFWWVSYLSFEKCFNIGFYAFSKFFLKIFLACPYGYYISQTYFVLHSIFLLWKLFQFWWISHSSCNFFHY